MEALGAAASVITIVTSALQSTKVIYEAVSSIKHGSDDVERLARSTNNLEKLLEVIKRVAEHAESTNSVAEGKLLEPLTPLVDQCANALHEIPPKLAKLQQEAKDRRWQKAKKHARVYLDTKSVAEMWNTVNHYVELLGTCLGNAAVDVGLYNAQKLHLLHDELSAASQDNRYQFSHVADIVQDQRALAQAGFDTLQAEFRQGSMNAREAATSHMQGIAELKTEQQQFGKAVATGYAEVLQKLHSISDRLETVPSMTSEQLSTLRTLIGMMSGMQLGIRTEPPSLRNNTTSEACLTADDSSNELCITYNSDIEGLLTKVGHLAQRIARHKYSKDAQLVIEDIGRLLGLVMQQVKTTIPDCEDLPRKRKVLCDYHYSELETEVQLMDGLVKARRALTASQTVLISDLDSKQLDEGDSSTVLLPSYTAKIRHQDSRRKRFPSVSLQNTVRSWDLRYGRLDAIFKTVPPTDAEDQGTEDGGEVFAAKLIITPITALPSQHQIVIDVSSRMNKDRTMYFTPTLTFRAMIDDDSKVFRVVMGGSVKKLKKLLTSGKASLGDCDSEGRSLLNFALSKGRRGMTKFLIQSGADVDTLEPDFIDYLVKPLEMFRSNDFESADEDLVRTEGCYKLLLEAGSDLESVSPMTDELWISAFSQALSGDTLVKLKALIDLGEPFISLESTGDNNRWGTIPLLLLADLHCRCFSGNVQMPDKVALLLGRGANVNARNSRGEICLHLALSEHDNDPYGYNEKTRWRWWRQYLSETKDILILMISAGADVVAVDEEGQSVSEVAIHSGKETVWIEALKYCRIDIRDVLARPNIDPAYSTALSSQYHRPAKSVTSKISLAEYLERRKLFRDLEDEDVYKKPEPRISSSEDDDSEDEDLTEETNEDDESMDEDWAEDISEDDYNENEDPAEEISEIGEVGEQEATGENENPQTRYKGSSYKGMAKIE